MVCSPTACCRDVDFDKSLMNCQTMSEKFTELAADSAWFSGAKAKDYQSLTTSDSDANGVGYVTIRS